MENTHIYDDDRALSFPIETLRSAGASLGDVRSPLTPPRTTVEELARRAESLLAGVIERERRGL